ncbi:MAG: FecR domain-containing protein [Deltaproteobacteria bacterium]|nr:FecR domain-containing protein [Deltaproteobacteria bacterium]
MTVPDVPSSREARDEVDELFDEARRLAAPSRHGSQPDWGVVWAEARRRRLRRVALAIAAGGLAAAAAMALILAPVFSEPTARTPPGPAASSPGPAAARPAEYRFLLPSPRVRIVAERDASLRVVSGGEVSLAAGAVWVHVDGRHGRVPFEVVTPDVRVAVEGTRFAVAAGGGAGSTVAVLDGVVHVRAAGREVVVGAGGQWRSGLTAPGRLDPVWRASLASFFPDGNESAPEPPGVRPPPARPVDGAAVAALPESGGDSRVGPEPAAPAVAANDGGDPREDAREGGDSGGSRPPPNAADELFRRAEEAMAAGRAEEAMDLLRQAADVAPGSALSGMALLELAAQARRLGRPELAGPACERYLAEQPAGEFRGEARIALCRIHAGTGRPDRSRECYAAYLAEEPDGNYAAEAARGVEAGAGEDGVP